MRSTYRVGLEFGNGVKHSEFEVTVKGAPLNQYGFVEVVFSGSSNGRHSGFDDCMDWIRRQGDSKPYVITEVPKRWDKYKSRWVKDYQNKTITEL